MNDTLSDQDIEYLRALRERGFAVCIFTPGEIANAEQEDVEDAMCGAGNEWIASEENREPT